MHKDITSSGKAATETDKDCEQESMIEEEKATLQHNEQSHSTEATKFSLTSLLTSTSSGTSHILAPLSSSSKISTASLTDTNQSLHQNSQDIKSPLTTNTFLTHRKALSSNFNGHNIEKSVLKCENNLEQFVKSKTDASLSTDTKSESRTNPLHTSDTGSSDVGNSNDESTTSLNLSTVKPTTEVNRAEPISECDGVHAPDTDDPSAPAPRTRTVGLMDLLTTAVEDKNSSMVLDTQEDKWMSPHAVKEVRVFSKVLDLVSDIIASQLCSLYTYPLQ